jgi:hypothetical protein
LFIFLFLLQVLNRPPPLHSALTLFHQPNHQPRFLCGLSKALSLSLSLSLSL